MKSREKEQETEERLGASDMIIDILLRRQEKTDKSLEDHVQMCGRLQKLHIILICVALLLIEAHSPEMQHLIDRIAGGLLQ